MRRDESSERAAIALVETFAGAMNEVLRRHGPIAPGALASALRQIADDLEAKERHGHRSL